MRSRRLVRPSTTGGRSFVGASRTTLGTLAPSDTGADRSVGPRSPVVAMRSGQPFPSPVVHCHEMTVNPTLRARSIRPTAAASSSAFSPDQRSSSPSDETSQSLKTTFTSRYPVPRSRSSTCSASPQVELIYRQGTQGRTREPHLMLVTRSTGSRRRWSGDRNGVTDTRSRSLERASDEASDLLVHELQPVWLGRSEGVAAGSDLTVNRAVTGFARSSSMKRWASRRRRGH